MEEKILRRIMLTVSYDGTNYHGWQIQPSSTTIEGELNKALSNLTGEEIKVIGASRTDAGVHALGNLAVFDTYSRIPADKFPYAVNERLPEDIIVRLGQEVEIDFHPRHCDTKKTYEYRILNTKFGIPTRSRYTHHVYYPMNVDDMNEAGKYLIGEHDFTSFCSVNAQSDTRVRTVYDVRVYRENDEIVIKVVGAGFLYNMVRIIAGTLLEVGRGRMAVNDISSILEAKNREVAGPTLPANGLTLIGYEFI